MRLIMGRSKTHCFLCRKSEKIKEATSCCAITKQKQKHRTAGVRDQLGNLIFVFSNFLRACFSNFCDFCTVPHSTCSHKHYGLSLATFRNQTLFWGHDALLSPVLQLRSWMVWASLCPPQQVPCFPFLSLSRCLLAPPPDFSLADHPTWGLLLPDSYRYFLQYHSWI